MIHKTNLPYVITNVSKNRPRKQLKVEAVSPIPLCFVKDSSLLHQVLQVSGVHLQPSDHVVHVALVLLIVNFTAQTIPQEISEPQAHFLNGSNKKQERLPDGFPQAVFHFLKVGSFFWILVPTAFDHHVHLKG